ncbi:hypothetical protein EDD85DRAFT_785176 [Armillaria nabsnona]|nr:hypothetical protein EDD85DRAFT_785176 [Armillaria nabsnona]
MAGVDVILGINLISSVCKPKRTRGPTNASMSRSRRRDKRMRENANARTQTQTQNSMCPVVTLIRTLEWRACGRVYPDASWLSQTQLDSGKGIKMGVPFIIFEDDPHFLVISSNILGDRVKYTHIVKKDCLARERHEPLQSQRKIAIDYLQGRHHLIAWLEPALSEQEIGVETLLSWSGYSMGGIFLSLHCMERLCESLCRTYDNLVKRLRGGLTMVRDMVYLYAQVGMILRLSAMSQPYGNSSTAFLPIKPKSPIKGSLKTQAKAEYCITSVNTMVPDIRCQGMSYSES